MIYQWLISQEQACIPYDTDSSKARIIWFLLRYVYGRRYWKEVAGRQRAIMSQFKASLKNAGVPSEVIKKAAIKAMRQAAKDNF